MCKEYRCILYSKKVAGLILVVIRIDSLSDPQSAIPVGQIRFLKIKRLLFRVNIFHFPHLEVISWCILEHKILQLIKALLDVIC